MLWSTLIAMACAGVWWFFVRDDLNVGGRLAINHCGMCHDLTARQVMDKGPPLWGLTERPPGTHPRYDYSPAFLEHVRHHPFEWNREVLEEFLQYPEKVIPGNVMSRTKMGHPNFYQDVDHSRFRKDLVAYIIQLK
ncbi:cytochrome c, testis [Magnetococcus marinus MC-1]|uniref:Cytochrome c, testis n=1 Tax=Magnetococcus marinus (strain ATCC BAA-1437 / JCM 17883 / MC-1) TaxID=156889 RepID=A0LCA9_MAGMM|nr:cytochrome c [Magnetococcus marinus]ABK45602.1 cytochrome c, testis [Magnetococcus marinus MC-1]